MAEKKKSKIDRFSNFDKLTRTLFSKIDPNYLEVELLDSNSSKLNDIISNELNRDKGISDGNIVSFISDTIANTKQGEKQSTNPLTHNTITDLFTNDMAGIFGQYQDLYKNKYVELADLKFITKFIPALGAAVSTTLDSIVGSESVDSIISRSFEYDPSITDAEKTLIEQEIERIEKDEKLLKVLKNRVYKKTLVSGKHYAYVVPYSDLFNEYQRLVDTKVINGDGTIAMMKQLNNLTNSGNTKASKRNAMENTTNVAIETVSLDSLTEAITSSSVYSQDETRELKNIFNKLHLPEVYGLESSCMIGALEDISAFEAMQKEFKSYSNTFNSIGTIDDTDVYSDGTVSKGSRKRGSKYKTDGTYVKYIDASQVISVDIHNQRVGYLLVHDTTVNKKIGQIKETSSYASKHGIVNTGSAFSGSVLSTDKQKSAISGIVDAVTDGIVANFSPKFVQKNAQYKKVIADCIIANGLINNDFQIQFVPANNVIEFTINDDGDGNGESMLANSLFPAKMLLSLQVAKLLLYMNKSGNKTLFYDKKSNVNMMDQNRVQRLIRSAQESQIAFGDLLSTNLSFSKFNRNGSMHIPSAPDGSRLFEIEVQEGQVVDLSTDYEDMLEKNAIMGTEVPDTILEYINAADYAKSIESAHIKYSISIASKQADLEVPTTELYDKLLQTSNLDDELKAKIKGKIKFKLARPRVLANANFNEHLSSMESLAGLIANIKMGQDVPEEQLKLKNIFMRKLAVKYLPFVDWDDIDSIFKDAMVEFEKENDLDSKSDEGSGDM